MLKTRVMPTLLYKDFTLVKGIGFDSWRRVGAVMQSVKVYNTREVDELVFLDITATLQNREPDFKTVDEIADECFMPLAVGGGIRKIEDIRRLLMVGADKVVLNTSALLYPALIGQACSQFGSQCIVVAIDFRHNHAGQQEVYTHAGSRPTGRDIVDWAKQAESLGAGEIFLTSVERDGTMTGYDTQAVRKVAEAVRIPVIASGGAGNYADMLNAIQSGASAVAAASIFHFTQQTPLEAKRFLLKNGIHVRINGGSDGAVS